MVESTHLGRIAVRSHMITTLPLLHFTRLQLAQKALEIGDGPFCFTDGCIVLSEHVGVGGRLAEDARRLEDLALGLYPLVDILYLLVQLVRLRQLG